MAKAPPAPTGDGQGEPAPHVKHPEAGTGHLAAKLARIAGQVGPLAKDSRVEGRRGFGYASIGAMAAALAPLIGDEGIAILPVEVQTLENGTHVDEQYGTRWITSLRVTWSITDGTDTFTAVTLGKSLDSNGSEKDTNQAHTFARINLYKLLFHLSEAGEDPEQKGAASGGGGAGAAKAAWDGEVPDVSDSTVSGSVVIIAPGRIGLSFEIQPRTVQTTVNGIVRQLGGKWDRDGSHYAIPEQNNEQAVALARGIGLTIPPKVAERYPAPSSTPPAEPPEDGTSAAPPVPPDAQGVDTDQVQFPTVGEQTHTDPPD